MEPSRHSRRRSANLLYIYIYIYIYIYVFFGPVKPGLGVIPSGQEIIPEENIPFLLFPDPKKVIK